VYRTEPHRAPSGDVEILVSPDILDPGFVRQAIYGSDAVITAVGPNFATRHNPRTKLTSPPDLHQQVARALITAMKNAGAPTKLISISTGSMGPADASMGLGPRTLLRFFRTVVVPNLGLVGKDLQAMETELAASGLDWYAPRPVKLTDGPLTGHVQAGERFALKAISRADVAYYALALAENPDPGSYRTPMLVPAATHRARRDAGNSAGLSSAPPRGSN